MADATVHSEAVHHHHPLHETRMPPWTQRLTNFAVFGILAVGTIYAAMALVSDLSAVPRPANLIPYLLLGVALLIALGFEFVNGFHDTANAVATVIYTHSLPPQVAVVWSGVWNFLGVVTSAGLVAFTVVSLLPVELILQVGSSAGYAMVFSLLIAAIIWNIGTWYFGIPNSSSHAMIGSIIGVGLANQLMGGPNGTSGVDWAQAVGVFRSLGFSPLIGFAASAVLLLIAKMALPFKQLYVAPRLPTTATCHSCATDPDLHGRKFFPRLERRSERDGIDNAHPDRCRADRLCAQSRRRARSGSGFCAAESAR